jgi:hypothetical protein
MSRGEEVHLISDLAKGHIVARCLHVVALHGVADALDGGTITAAELAARTGLHADALDRVLRLLAAHGVFAESGDGYAHTAASRLLRSDHPESMRAYVRMHGLPTLWNGFHELEHAVRTGRPVRDWSRHVADLAAHSDAAAVFNEAMVRKSRAVVPAVLEAYDFGALEVVVDVGGGRGHLLAAIVERWPGLCGVLFELPHVVADAARIASPRLRIASGDFFADRLPAAHAYVLMDLLHDWPDEGAIRILSSVRHAALPGARVLIIETLRPEEPGPHIGKTLDVIMLAVTGGRERSFAEHAALLEAAGLHAERVVATGSAYSIVEATNTMPPCRA